MNQTELELLADPAMKALLEYDLGKLKDKLQQALKVQFEAKEITPYDRDQISRLFDMGCYCLWDWRKSTLTQKDTKEPTK